MAEPRGILRNKNELRPRRPLEEDLDRKEVIRNTIFNTNVANEKSKGDEIRAKLARAKLQDSNGGPDGSQNGQKVPEHLKWDEINLYKTEQEKCATMKIDEPKTPYTGGFNPGGEYYQDDAEDIPGFDLGPSEEKTSGVLDSMNGGLIYVDPDQQVEEPEEEQEEEEELLTAEERHKRFEEKRKEHYHMKAMPLKHGVQLDDD